jgi:hypothetical protein
VEKRAARKGIRKISAGNFDELIISKIVEGKIYQMGSSESRSDFSSIYSNILIDITIIFIHLFVFVFISALANKKGLQSELESANKEGDCVRQRLRYQNEQLERVKEKHDLDKHDDGKKYGELWEAIFVFTGGGIL